MDKMFMRTALHEAAKGVGLTSPNPPVGCVISKDGIILGKGYHRKAGKPHAEREALAAVRNQFGDQAARLLRGATLYVTLEPCSTSGRTPPCTDGIIEAGIKRVVYAATDPNPHHQGEAARLLHSNGIEVETGVLENDALEQLRPFNKWVTTGIPWVIAKAAISLDGRITRPKGESQWLTGEKARADAQKLRLRSDAIIVGAGTVRADNPLLNLRGPGKKTGKDQPWRVVLTRSGQLPQDAHLFTDEHRNRTLVFKRRSLQHVLKALGKKGVTTVMIEGGSSILTQAFSQNLVDEVCFYIAPFVSGSGIPVIDSAGFTGGSKSIHDLQMRKVGHDVRISGLMPRN
ncbi:MAG: bifunctional diaminohydroxyphosphoribosylaminopyrimidine deaminase/5-amino-6-(5-phosphoribosylamino)uracil reductase RibD [Verrucomicrobiae bacterium]|nr:bifunctional diaminohydroxyphosphoribosylaminopyrimidine deaminase/5-amino-6-(5-phosphoribosylamino)uracil reductase RibD [Verrucomicrobiae bacterium]